MIGGRYRVDDVIGEGGMGVVVKATHVVLDQRVAIKVLRPDAMRDAQAVERFVREARAAAQVKSEHVVRVHDVMMLDSGTPCIVMEYVEGPDLASVIDSLGALPVHRAARYALQICEAMAETHAVGIVHGDLKPENMLVEGAGNGADGKVKILDFGISRILSEEGRRHLAREESYGTPAYMAPERFTGAPADPRADIWALGAVLYEMLTGGPPFGSDDPTEVADRILGKEPPPPITRADMDANLAAIVAGCLERDPGKRIESALMLVAHLEPLVPLESSLQRIERVPTQRRMAWSSGRHAETVVLPERQKGYGKIIAACGVLATIGLVAGGAALWLRSTGATAAGTPADGTSGAAPTASVQAQPAPFAEGSAKADDPRGADAREPTGAASTTSAAASAPIRRPSAGRPATPPRAPSAPSAPGDRFGTRK